MPTSSGGSGSRLRGRRSEREALRKVITDIRDGHSRGLVVQGEAGVGKTAMLEFVAQSSAGCQLARASGVESEMELAFSGLQQLCAPMMEQLDVLPGPQREAVSTAFGLRSGEPPNRFLVGLGILGMLAEASVDRPLVCLIDDVQWLDQASTQTLAFVARRLLAERVALVFAVRNPPGAPELAGLPELQVRGLDHGDSRDLLESAIPGRIDERVRDRIIAEARGNPLALLELPRGLTTAELAGGFGRPDLRPVTSQIEESFLRRIRSLPADTQRLLLIAAAEPVGDVPLLRRAAQLLGIGPDSEEPAEAEGLIELRTRVRFRHPLVRSAAYRAANLHDRQEIHGALAEATDPGSDPDRRAWHRAHAAVNPDESVAKELVQSAARARGRGGVAAEAAFLERATELTMDPALRAERALAAAYAKYEAGAADSAQELLATAALGPISDLQAAQLARLQAQIAFARSHGNDATPLLLDAAGKLAALDDELARQTYFQALGAAIFAGRLGHDRGLREAAAEARAAAAGPPTSAVDLLLDGLATRFAEGYLAGAVNLRHALQALTTNDSRGSQEQMHWLGLAWPTAQVVAHELWDDDAWNALATRAVHLAREAGALAVLPVALIYQSGLHVHAGEFGAAAALIEESHAITAATGLVPVMYTALQISAWKGEQAKLLSQIDLTVDDARRRGEGRLIGLTGYVRAVLYNGLGHYLEALAGAQLACEYEDLGLFGWSLIELIEAAQRSGEHTAATQALHQLEQRTQAAATDWGLGTLARSRALLSTGEMAESLYREAIERLGRTRIVIHLARTHLIFGEWLRRENRRQDARDELRTAYDLLSGIGAAAFAERARRELQATGETVRKRSVETRDALTAQEAQIARLAAEGLTNPEIGAQLFISPHTVEWHLRKVFVKLGVTSRRQLQAVTPVAP